MGNAEMNLARNNELDRDAAPCDWELVLAAQGGDKCAFATLMERHQSALRALAYRVTSDLNSVDDLVQEVMFCAWTHLAELQDPTKFRPWLSSITRNTARNWQRHQQRHAPKAEHSIDTLEKLPSNAPTPLQEVQSREAVHFASRAISGLSGRYREALLLYFSLGESHAEVASVLGLSEANVRQRLTRARKKLRCELDGLQRTGRQLAMKSSSAAAILLFLSTRQAAANTIAVKATLTTQYSAKLLVGMGVVGGSALISCVVAIVMLLQQNPTTASSSRTAATPMLLMEASPERVTLVSPSAITNTSSESVSGTEVVHGTVRIGSGKSGQKRHELPATGLSDSDWASSNPQLAENSHLSGKAQLVLAKAQKPNKRTRQRSRASSRSRIKKHGPAVLRHKEDKPARVLMKPSIDLRAVRRELWQQ
ncbi:MAG: RNA polymerase sigma factor [Kofleriaceae bacterium]|nr:RNA polymerase sigma factor [Kofleriaceae bacterium]